MNHRVVVISDTHGSTRALREIVMHYEKEAACFLHCGDGEREVDSVRLQFPNIKLYTVRGNCDFDSSLPMVQQVEVGGRSIFFTHGHHYQVKASLEPLKAAARNVGATIALFGHSHCGYTEYDEGLYVMNPGSPVQPRDSSASFGVIDIGSMGVVCNLVSYGGLWR